MSEDSSFTRVIQDDADDARASLAAAFRPSAWFYIPLRHGSKKPLEGQSWKALSTNDPDQHDAWIAAGYNLGVDTEKSGLTVFDTDDGQVGEDALATLEAVRGRIGETYTVDTPNGVHRYCEGVTRSTVTKLGDKIDTRSVGGYVVAAGSVVNGRPYTLRQKVRPAPVPAWVAPALAVAKDRVALAAVGELDQPQNVSRAVTYLRQAEPSVEGQGGDDHAITVANKVLDLGVSPETCLDLMYDHWNGRCLPSWDYDDLKVKIGNAAKYRENGIGAHAVDTAGEVFADAIANLPSEPATAPPDDPAEVDRLLASAPPPPPGQDAATWAKRWLETCVAAGLKAGDPLRPTSALEYAARPARTELVRGWLYERSLMVQSAKFGSGKSWIALDTCASLSAGLPGFGDPRFEVAEAVDTLYCAGEDAEGLATVRLDAWIKHKGLSDDEATALKRRLLFTEAVPLIKSEEETERLIGWCAAYDFHPKLIVLDTYAKSISGAGSANEDAVATLAVSRAERLRDALGASVLILAHVPKNGGAGGPVGSQALPAGVDMVWEASHQGNTLKQPDGSWEVTLTNPEKNRHGALKPDILLRGQNVRLARLAEPGLVFVAAPDGAMSKAAQRKTLSPGQVGRALVDAHADARLKAKATTMTTEELAKLIAGHENDQAAVVKAHMSQLTDNARGRFAAFIHTYGSGGRGKSHAWQYPASGGAPIDPPAEPVRYGNIGLKGVD